MRKTWILLLALLVVLAAAGCGSRDMADYSAEGSAGMNKGTAWPAVAPSPDGRQYYDASGSLPAQSSATAEQRLIRTAELTLDVQDMDEVLTRVSHLTKAAGGFIAQSSTSGQVGSRYAAVTLRIPAGGLDAVLSELEALGVKKQRNVGQQDVTLDYVDLEARIRNAERQEERLLEILDKAETVEDILRVEQELARVRGQLESMTTQFRYLKDRVDYATVHLYLNETPAASPTITGVGLKGVWQRGVTALINTVNYLLTSLGVVLVAVFALLPYLVLLVIIIVPAGLVIRQRNKKKPGAPEA